MLAESVFIASVNVRVTTSLLAASEGEKGHRRLSASADGLELADSIA
jgi:hypothetical protein